MVPDGQRREDLGLPRRQRQRPPVECAAGRPAAAAHARHDAGLGPDAVRRSARRCRRRRRTPTSGAGARRRHRPRRHHPAGWPRPPAERRHRQSAIGEKRSHARQVEHSRRRPPGEVIGTDQHPALHRLDQCRENTIRAPGQQRQAERYARRCRPSTAWQEANDRRHTHPSAASRQRSSTARRDRATSPASTAAAASCSSTPTPLRRIGDASLPTSSGSASTGAAAGGRRPARANAATTRRSPDRWVASGGLLSRPTPSAQLLGGDRAAPFHQPFANLTRRCWRHLPRRGRGVDHRGNRSR